MMIKLRLKKRRSLLDQREGKAFQAEETASANVLGQEGAGARERLQHGLSTESQVKCPGQVKLEHGQGQACSARGQSGCGPSL